MFKCTAPKWVGGGALPKKGDHEFTATFDWIENGRIMPVPVNQSQTVKVTVQKPSFTFAGTKASYPGECDADYEAKVDVDMQWDCGDEGMRPALSWVNSLAD